VTKKIAIIPARSGSKRILNKNTKDFHGLPIITYSIEAAIQSGLYDEVMVSTDCETIRDVALKYGAKAPFLRSKENSNDFATTVDVLLEVVEWYAANGVNFDEATCIYACSPFINVNLLRKSFEMLTFDCDCVFPVIAYSHPIQRAMRITDKGLIKPFFDLDENQRTQDFEKAFYDAGMFYSFNVNRLLQNKSLRTNNTRTIEINEMNAQDIDNDLDWKLAELKYKLFLSEKI
jgi:pseudaminic acid cytidylyltransferase